MKEEIQSSDWGKLCERLNEFEHGQIITIHAVEHDGARRELGRALVLESIEFTAISGCNDAVVVRAAGGFEHQAIAPLHIRLVRNPTGGFNPVEIDAEEGSVILHFKPALNPTVLAGLARVGWSGVAR